MLDGNDREVGFDAAATATTEVSWREADRQLRRLSARRSALDAAEAHWIRVARRAEVHRHLGLGSFVEYLERTLGYAPRTALDRMRVAEALAALPQTTAALADGRVSYSAVRELSRVVTAATEKAWLASVDGKTLRDVEAMVAGREEGDLPTTPPTADPKMQRVVLELTPEAYALLQATHRQLETETGERLDDSGLVTALCTAPSRGPRHQLAVTTCNDCQRSWIDAAGKTIEIGAPALESARCDAAHVGRVDGSAPARTTIDIPAAVRRQVERRDRGRCVVPGCRASRYVDIHHIRARADGGPHTASNLCLLCTAHHDAVHRGRLRITGAAPALTFEHADGRPYGAPPPPPPIDLSADAALALRTLGFSASEARAAVDAARAHVGDAAAVEDWIPAALRASPRPTSRSS